MAAFPPDQLRRSTAGERRGRANVPDADAARLRRSPPNRPARPIRASSSPASGAGDRMRADRRDRARDLLPLRRAQRRLSAGLLRRASASRRWRSSSFSRLHSYSVPAFRRPVAAMFRIAGGWTVVFLVVFAAMFFLKLDGVVSRVWMASWFALGLRRARGRARDPGAVRGAPGSSAGRLQQRAVIVGGGAIGGRPAARARQGRRGRSAPARRLRRPQRRSLARTVEGYPKLGNVDDLVEFARSTRIDLVIFALPITAEQRILQMLRKLWVLPIDIRLAAHANRLRFRPRSYSYVGQVPVLDLFDKPIADWDVVIKLAFDKIVGTLALDRAVAGPGGDRDRDQARLRRARSCSSRSATASTTN